MKYYIIFCSACQPQMGCDYSKIGEIGDGGVLPQDFALPDGDRQIAAWRSGGNLLVSSEFRRYLLQKRQFLGLSALATG